MTPEQLKASILQRAMEGKLVPQDPNDEPASELLKRIKAEKEKLIKEGKIKRDKNETEIFRGDDGLHYEKFQDGSVKQIDVPFEIPESWGWVKLNNIIKLTSGRDLPKEKYSDKEIRTYPYITGASNFSNFKIMTNRYTDDNSVLSYRGDILITVKGTIGELAFNPFKEAYIARQVMAISGVQIYSDYLFFYLQNSISILKNKGQSLIPGISRETILNLFIPIPPLKEQKRIIEILFEAIPKFKEYSCCYHELKKLNSEFLDKLRKSILQYAMQGKLVPQDATDEPVEVLLEKIREEKQRLFAEGKLQKKDLQESIIYQGDDNSYYKMTDVRKEQWLVQRVKDIFRTIPTKKYQIKQSEILKEGLYPVVSQSKKLIEGYSNSKDKLYQHSKPIIVFGDHTRIVKLIDFDFVVGADGVKLMDPIYIDSEFGHLCLKFCCLDLKNRGYSRHYSHLQNMYIGIPDKTMQLRIVEKIKILDKYVKLLENKINKHI
jgi:type I restriction-modification system, S subunit (fragment)